MSANSPLVSLFKEQLENESTGIAKEHDLLKRGDYLIWWYFLRLKNFEPGDINEIVCEGGNDLAIDAIFIDDDNFVHFYQFKNPETTEKAFPEGDVDKVLAGLNLILSRRHKTIANPELIGRIEEIYQIIPSGYLLHLVTSGSGISNEAKQKLDGFVEGLGGPSESFFAWQLEDVKYLQDTFYQKNLPTVAEPIVFSLQRQPPYQVRSSDHDCYLFHAASKVLAGLYEKHGEQLLQQNIRVYRGNKSTNASIMRTCSGDDAANFFHFNNGITFLCESAVWDQFVGKLTVEKAQIVNGGQTIRVIHKAWCDSQLKPDVLVSVRVITSQGDKEFGSNVAVNLNNQNRIESSFLRSNDPRVVQLSSSLASQGWYLERREDEVKLLSDQEKGQVENRIGHKLEGRVLKLKEATQAYVATFFRQPELAKKNPKRMFLGSQEGGYFERIFSADLTAEKFLIAQMLKWQIDDFVREFNKRKRRKDRMEDWKKDYMEILAGSLVTKHSNVLDQVIPQSSVFLCGILFEEQVTLLRKDPNEVLRILEKGNTELIIKKLELLIDFAKQNPKLADKSWPTLLKSQPFFDHFASYLKGRLDTGGKLSTEI